MPGAEREAHMLGEEMASETEIWEPTTESAVHVLKKNPQDPTGWRNVKVGGKRGTRRLQLTREEREHNQQMVAIENKHLDPFLNGQLLCIQGTPDSSSAQMSDDQLRELLKIEDDDTFMEAVTDLGSEVLLRRLLLQAEDHATKRRYDMVYDYVSTTFRVGYTQKSVREMESQDESVPTVI